MLQLTLHVLLIVKFRHRKIKIIVYLLQCELIKKTEKILNVREAQKFDQDLAEQNMINYFIHQSSEDGHAVMSNKMLLVSQWSNI